jgi:hypothetical protein
LLPPETGISEEIAHHLTGLATEAGFSVVNLTNAYANHDLETLIVAPWDRHPNAKGHQLIADHLYEAIQTKALIPGFGLLSSQGQGKTTVWQQAVDPWGKRSK